MAQTPGNDYKERLPRGLGIQAKAKEGGPGHKARGEVGTKAGLWLISSCWLQLRGYINFEDGLQADGGLHKALCWGRCDPAAA